MAQTNHRTAHTVVVAVGHQAAFASAASTAAGQKWPVLECTIDPGFGYVHPRGAQGSYRPKDSHLKVFERPRATLEVPSTPKVSPFVWEYALGGQPIATLANTDLSEAGDSGNDLSAWTFAGIRPGFNTSSDFKLYVKLTDESPGAGQALVQVYSDSGRTALVASGSGNNSTTVTLAEQNSSGLSGTVALATPSSSNLTGIILTILQVRPQEAGVLARFFTLWRDHGSSKGLERITGCAVEKLTRISEEEGLVRYQVEIVGSDYSFDDTAGGTFTPGSESGDLQVHVHGTMALTSDMDSGQVVEHVIRLELAVENDLEPILANAAVAGAIVKKGVKAYPITWTQKLTDESQNIVERGIADSFESIRVVDTYSAKTNTFLVDKVKSAEPSFPAFKEDGWAEVEHRMQAVEETAASPTAPLTVTLIL